MTDERDRDELIEARPHTRRTFLGGVAAGGALLAGGGILAACGGSSGSSAGSSTSGAGSTGAASGSTAVAGTPKRGGNLRVAILGGGPTETLDAGAEVLQTDAIRCFALYNGLVRLSTDAKSVVMDLAEEITPSADAKTWTIRIRDGVTFHNGKAVTADDVIFTLLRVSDPKKPLDAAALLAPMDRTQMKKLDDRTIRLTMKTPYSSFLEQICQMQYLGIVPTDYDPKKPVGTGPFKYQSFTPGGQSVFVRNENYFKTNRPYLDSLTILASFASDTAAFNALQSGEVDIFSQAPLNLLAQVKGTSAIVPSVSLPSQWTPFTMRVDKAPFTDVRVRQAMRLIVDRKQLIDTSLSGQAAIGNDVFSQWDKDYDTSLHRDQDLEQAKSLLKQAGHDGLNIELVTSDFAAGVVEGAQVFAQQAKGAGVNVKINKVPTSTFYGPSYLQWTFAQDYWSYGPYLQQVVLCALPSSPFNETHWNDANYQKLNQQANATTDPAKQREIIYEMQKIDFNEGGYIIPSYNRQLDLLTSKVQGIKPSATGIPIGNADWENIWLS